MFIELFEADMEVFLYEFHQFIMQFIVVRIWVLVWVLTQQIEYIRFFNIVPEILECLISIHSLFYITNTRLMSTFVFILKPRNTGSCQKFVWK